MNLFNDPELDSPEEKRKRAEAERLRLEAIKETENRKRQEKRALIEGVTDSAFWLAYCSMQKTIRQNDVERTRMNAFVAWAKNPWLTYKRLHTILLEDIGPVNPELLIEVSNFRANDKSYNNAADIVGLAEKMAKSLKNRDGDTLYYVDKYGKDYGKRDAVIAEMAAKHPDADLLGDHFDIYDNPKFPEYKSDEKLAKIISFCKHVAENLSKETQGCYVPYGVKYRDEFIKKGGDYKIVDNCNSPSHGLFYRDLVPFTVLDTHAQHGKMTMTILKKKVQENDPEFISHYGIPADKLPTMLFFLEGAMCKQEIDVSEIKAGVTRGMAYESGLREDIRFEEYYAAYHERILKPLVGLRKWVFEKRLDEHVTSMLKTLEKMKDYVP